MHLQLLLLFGLAWWSVDGLDNGLALTPPMGWLTWERFRCNTDCKKYPDTCISENLIKSMADHMVSDGYLTAGYEYVIIDDCWPADQRGPDGRLQPNADRFPGGMKNLSDYVHSKGLKFGLYEDFGSKTCGGYPGSEFYLGLDAQTFADWGVDYLKFDGCNSDPKDMHIGYPAMSRFLNKTGRPIVFSCEWPLYVQLSGSKPNYTAIQQTCNLWRNHVDIDDKWESVNSAISFYADDYGGFVDKAKPGAWNDPDMLVVGDFGLNQGQSRVQMGMWSLMASPLIMSNDLRTISDDAKQLLQNKYLIAINQDSLGVQGKILIKGVANTTVQVWSKPISPAGSFAIAFLQPENPGQQTTLSVLGKDLGLVNNNGYKITNAFTGANLGVIKPSFDVQVAVLPTDMEMITAVPVQV